MGARAMQEGIGSNLCNFNRTSLDLKFAGAEFEAGSSRRGRRQEVCGLIEVRGG